jgi:uncharacterized membrane protein YhaH (DUF805 family)
MTFQEAIKDGFGKYVQFSGRSSRSAYWYWVLFEILAGVVGEIVDAILGTGVIVAILLSLALFLPGIAVAIRRLHDTGRTGWWLLLWFLPFIGPIVLLVFYLLKSDGPNKYGAGPDEAPGTATPAV